MPANRSWSPRRPPGEVGSNESPKLCGAGVGGADDDDDVCASIPSPPSWVNLKLSQPHIPPAPLRKPFSLHAAPCAVLTSDPFSGPTPYRHHSLAPGRRGRVSVRVLLRVLLCSRRFFLKRQQHAAQVRA
ncbi:unnamed protein product [Gadus morhua 'NCC']